ncbi:MAG: hypothetical protein H6719_38630 [Sandaracinaceae bacterium]|nr:hypothetical protein [Sandaracinaceae bacterium]
MNGTRWMLLTLSLAFAASTGCAARTICDDAVDKLNECGVPADRTGSCDTAVDECEARCINTATCEDIRGALSGTPNAYTACDDACR